MSGNEKEEQIDYWMKVKEFGKSFVDDPIKTIQEQFAVELAKQIDKEILKQIEDDKNSVES